MKVVLYIIVILVIIYMSFFTYLSFMSLKAPRLGVLNGRLRPCPGTPNCVLSEEKGASTFIEPFAIRGDSQQAWKIVKEVVKQGGGRIENATDEYLWATFRTTLWHFVDDLELRLDKKNNVIHVRSASRVGRGDMGMNRKRVEELRAVFGQKLPK